MTVSRHVPSEACSPDCFRCKLLGLTLGLPRDLPSRTYSKAAPAEPKNSYEKGIARDDRGMPYLRGDLSEMPVKEFNQHRHEILEKKRALQNGAPLTSIGVKK
jgi:hypothetical protein